MSARKISASRAGSWYPTGQKLTNMLNEAFSKAKVTQSPKKVKAIISPHAGYVYCVATAAYAYAAIDPSLYDRVVIIGPSHRLYTKQSTIVEADFCGTPFGDIAIDTKEVASLISKHKDCFKYLDIRSSQNEHSLEMQLPLIKKVFGEKPITVIPIMIGDLSEKVKNETVQALKPIVNDPNTLLVVSSDFCHWGSDFDYTYLPEGSGQIYELIEKLDREATVHIKSCNSKEFSDYINKTGNTICGATPIEIAMDVIGNYEAEFPMYSQSEKVTSKRDCSVSYCAGILRI
jgi:AmmeMemoRadiSam system protein B